MSVTLILRDGRHLIVPTAGWSTAQEDLAQLVRELNCKAELEDAYTGFPVGDVSVAIRVDEVVALVVEPDESHVDIRVASAAGRTLRVAERDDDGRLSRLEVSQ